MGQDLGLFINFGSVLAQREGGPWRRWSVQIRLPGGPDPAASEPLGSHGDREAGPAGGAAIGFVDWGRGLGQSSAGK